jgi:DNA-directed RNA polymerase alpha subunit
LHEEKSRKDEALSPGQLIAVLELGSRADKVLAEAGIHTIGDVLARLGDEEGLTNLRGFGLKSLATLKKQLRARGFVLPGDQVAEETEA